MQHFLSFAPAFFTTMLTVCMLWVIWFDLTEYVISNRLNAFLLILFVVASFVLPISWINSLMVAGVVFVVLLGIFTLGVMGGGDVKLLAVLSLWAGWPQTLDLLLWTSVWGGVLVLVLVPLRRIIPLFWQNRLPSRPLPRILTRKEPLPYGLAIASAFLMMLWTDSIPALHP